MHKNASRKNLYRIIMSTILQERETNSPQAMKIPADKGSSGHGMWKLEKISALEPDESQK